MFSWWNLTPLRIGEQKSAGSFGKNMGKNQSFLFNFQSSQWDVHCRIRQDRPHDIFIKNIPIYDMTVITSHFHINDIMGIVQYSWYIHFIASHFLPQFFHDIPVIYRDMIWYIHNAFCTKLIIMTLSLSIYIFPWYHPTYAASSCHRLSHIIIYYPIYPYIPHIYHYHYSNMMGGIIRLSHILSHYTPIILPWHWSPISPRPGTGDVVLAAVRDCPMALEHASELLRRDRDFVTMAMRISVRAAGGLSQAWGWGMVGDGGIGGKWWEHFQKMRDWYGKCWKILLFWLDFWWVAWFSGFKRQVRFNTDAWLAEELNNLKVS